MTKRELQDKIAELRLERQDLKRQVMDNEPNIEDLREVMELHPKRQVQLGVEAQLVILRNDLSGLQDELNSLKSAT